MKFKDMTVFKVGSGFIWKKGRKVLRWSAEGVSTGRPKKLPSKVEEDLLAEVQRLRAECACLKTCKAWFWEKSGASAKSAGSSKTEANIGVQGVQTR